MAILSEPARDDVVDVLQPEHLYSPSHRTILGAVLALHNTSQPCDVVAVAEWLRSHKQLGKAGGSQYLGELMSDVPALADVRRHAQKLVQLYQLRQAIDCCHRKAAEGYGATADVPAYLEQLEAEVWALTAQQQASTELVPVREPLAEVFRKLSEGTTDTGLATGLDRFDSKTGGLRPGELWILAARPAMGKSALAGQVAATVAGAGHAVALFSLEMPKEQYAQRLVAMRSGVDLTRLREGNVYQTGPGARPDEWPTIAEAAKHLSATPLHLDDTPGITVASLRSKCRRLASTAARADTPLGLVVVDYLQLMGSADRASNREAEVSAISRGLKRLAGELKVPVLALSQLNRQVETRGGDKRPRLSDLRESGAIEQDADGVLFLFRADAYRGPYEQNDGAAELSIAKQRNGPLGRVQLQFYGRCMRFTEEGDE